jgi:hypothetical protein
MQLTIEGLLFLVISVMFSYLSPPTAAFAFSKAGIDSANALSALFFVANAAYVISYVSYAFKLAAAFSSSASFPYTPNFFRSIFVSSVSLFTSFYFSTTSALISTTFLLVSLMIFMPFSKRSILFLMKSLFSLRSLL